MTVAGPAASAEPRDGGRAPSRVVVIGGGIAGLATAALLASRGHSVDLLEKNDELGGRVGSIERDGFRFDTGASWYLMPEVFEHFFSLLGTTAGRGARPRPCSTRATGCSSRATPSRSTSGRDRRAQPGALRVGRAGRRARRFDAYLDSARGDLRHRPAPLPLQQLRRPRRPSCAPTSLRRTPRLGAAADPVARSHVAAHVRRQPAAPGARLPGGVPRLVPEPRAEHVPPDEPPRPGRRGALPAGRVHPAHRGDRRAGRAARRAAAHRRRGHADPHRRRRPRSART